MKYTLKGKKVDKAKLGKMTFEQFKANYSNLFKSDAEMKKHYEFVMKQINGQTAKVKKSTK